MGAFTDQLALVVGRRHVLTSTSKARPFATGYRFGFGDVEAVVRPANLLELWRVLKACVAADRIVIAQAANTGLTGGSTPDGQYDRPVVIINTLRISGVRLLRGGKQVVCFAGSTLHELERVLAPLGREPHSVIGSGCIGASVVGGVCNNSGGALVRRGPSYTEYALFARLDEEGRLSLHNHLGLELGEEPERVLAALDDWRLGDPEVCDNSRAASATDYDRVVRDVSANTPARFNADPSRLYDASGSAGRIIVFAVRLDTFSADEHSQTFYIGSNDPAEFTALRRNILTTMKSLPISGEYIHRTAFDLATTYGKDIFLAIEKLGTNRLPSMFAAKNRIDAAAVKLGFKSKAVSDRLMQAVARLFPSHLPARMLRFRDRFEHHLLLKVAREGIDDARALLGDIFPSSAGDMFECTVEEERKAFLHRFAVAGAAVRYRAIHAREVEDIIALDVALRRNDSDWFEVLPPEIAEHVLMPIYYGHFLCHVFHQDYIVRKGADPVALEHRMLDLLDARGAEYPAEHNVGHLYRAKPALAEHYRALDPTNSFNPGIGRTSRNKAWADIRSANSASKDCDFDCGSVILRGALKPKPKPKHGDSAALIIWPVVDRDQVTWRVRENQSLGSRNGQDAAASPTAVAAIAIFLLLVLLAMYRMLLNRIATM